MAALSSKYRVLVSVVVVNYNAGTLLSECVALALPQSSKMIVVDNFSADNSLCALHQRFAGEPCLHVVGADRNLGFAVACNLGASYTRTPYLLFLNPDCLLLDGTLSRLVEVMEDNPRAAVAGGLLLNPNGTEQPGGRRAIPTPWRSFVRAFGLARFADRWPKLFFDFHLHKQPLPEQPIEVEAISGAMMLVRREAIEEVGWWDEGYFLHCEDLDWCMRFRKQGWKILFISDAPAVHYRGTCSRSRPIFVEWHKHKGMIRFYRKFFRHQYPLGLMGLVTVGVWLRFSMVATYYTVKHIGRRLKPGHG